MNVYHVFLGYTFAVALTGGALLAVTVVQNRRAAQNRAGKSRPALPQRLPQRIVTPGSCECAECDALVEQVREAVAVAISRAEAAAIDSEWTQVAKEWTA